MIYDILQVLQVLQVLLAHLGVRQLLSIFLFELQSVAHWCFKRNQTRVLATRLLSPGDVNNSVDFWYQLQIVRVDILDSKLGENKNVIWDSTIHINVI